MFLSCEPLAKHMRFAFGDAAISHRPRLTLIRRMARVISRGAVPALLRRWELRTGRVLSVSQPLQKAGFPDITHNLRKKGKEPTQTPLSLYQHGHSCEQVGMGLSV